MFDGGADAAPVEKAGCEAANKCCFCFDIACGLKVVAGLSWCNTVGMVIIAFAMAAVSAVATGAASIGADSSNFSNNMKNMQTNTIQLVQGMVASDK